MKYTQKAINIVNDTWEYLENNYKGREMLPTQIIFEHLEHNNTGVNFIGSRMNKDLEVIK